MFRPQIANFIVCFSLILLPGCTVFYPRFDPFASERTSSAYEEIAFLTSAIELGKFIDPTTYGDTVDKYASIDGKLAAASQRVSALTAPNSVSREARSLLQRQIEDCRARVKSLATRHKNEGLQPNAGLSAPALGTCDQASQAANAMR